MANNIIKTKQYNKFVETNDGEIAIRAEFAEADEAAALPFTALQDLIKNSFLDSNPATLRVVLGGVE